MEELQRDKQQKLFADCVQSLVKCTELVGEYFTPEESETHFKQIKKVAKSYCEADLKNGKVDVALKLTSEHVNKSDGSQIEDIDNLFKEKLKDCVVGSEPLEEHSIIKQIERIVMDNQAPRDVSANCSLVSSQLFQVPVDPITKCPIKVPSRSKPCNHVYEHQTILEYVKLRKGKPVKCPYIGCTNVNLRIEDLWLDQELQRKISSHVQNDSSLMSISDLE